MNKPTKETLLDKWGLNQTSVEYDEAILAEQNGITRYYGPYGIKLLVRQLPIEEGEDPYKVFADAVKQHNITGVYYAHTIYKLNPITDEVELQFIVQVTCE